MKLLSRYAHFVSTVALLLTVGCQSASLEQNPPAVALNSSTASGAPGNVSARYTAEGLRQAFAHLCQRLGYRAMRLEVDQSEFPFLVYGVLEGSCDFKDIRDTLNSMTGYAYTSCVTLISRSGSRTIFA